MAYERTWQFCPVVGPRVPVSGADDIAYCLWTLKSQLRGEIGGATQGLWTVEGSSDGTTAGMDGTDRWTSTYDLTKIPQGLGAAARGWMVLKSPLQPNGVYIYLCLANSYTGSSTYATIAFANLPFAGSSTTANPTSGAYIFSNVTTDLLWTPADLANPARYYFSLTSTGDFWFIKTRLGFAENALMAMNPVGCKGTDQSPLFCFAKYTAGANVLSGSAIFTPATGNATKRWNGSAGYQCFAPPPVNSLLDSADSSLFDFPAWVIVGDTSNIGTWAQMHARGRLPDVGLCGGGTAGPVATGNVIRDTLGNIKYVICGCMLLPYNAALT
jgi:hypothetical protein